MRRIVLEEKFETRLDEEGKEYQFKLGEIVIYERQLTPEQLIICRSKWSAKYLQKIEAEGIDV